MEILPAIDLMDGKVVRLIRGQPSNIIVYSDNPCKVALEWEKSGVPGIHVIDLNAAFGSGNNRKIVKKICENIRLPINFGGGLHTIEDIEEAFSIGVSRVIVGSAIFTRKLELEEVLSFGKDKVIVAIDHKNGKVTIDGWKTVLSIDIYDAMKSLWSRGARLFLTTNTQTDGTLEGIDIQYLKKVEEFLKQVYVAGGISSISDLLILKQMKVKGVVLGRVLYDKIIDIKEALEVAKDDCS
ncbi:MAG: 1-(5-phosphoribosyl)-5-[(5-phosphoribosylamino)methylideneamino] imidazole-4-carboxamide isomerase [Nitrososphaeria archaeon]|nr:1-(5-phosphoribosyl)-5-[(5-phosphoribosylamino)methylideneamino] imidazole-4-carboxamide isomerase [Nitrososphaeria archaeon]